MVQSSREDLVGYYFQEVQTYIPEIKKGLSLLKTSGVELQVVSEMYRLFHNIKGAASQVYLKYLSGAAELAEFMLGQTLEEGAALSPAMISYLDDTVDKICDYCSHDKRDNDAESDLLQEKLFAFKRLYAQQENTAGISLYEKTAQLLTDDCDTPADIAVQGGSAVFAREDCIGVEPLRAVIRRVQQLVDAMLTEMAVGREGYGPTLRAVQKAVAEIADRAEELKMSDEGGFLRDLEILLQKACIAGLAPHQDKSVVVGYFMSLLCMQIESMLLRYLDGVAAQTGDATVVFSQEAALLLRDFTSSFKTLLVHPTAIDRQSATRIEERMQRIESFLPADGAGYPASHQGDFSSDSPHFPIPEMNDDFIADAFADQFLNDSFAEVGALDTWSEGSGALFADEAFPDERESAEDTVLHEIFREECEDHLIVISRSLNSLEVRIVERIALSPEVREVLGAMRRAVHTLKGAAAMVGYEQLAACAHSLEDMLDWLYDDAGHIGPDDLQTIAAAIDLIELLAQQPTADHATRVTGLQQTIARYLESGPAAPQSEKEDFGTGQIENFPPVQDGNTDLAKAAPFGEEPLRSVIRRMQQLVDAMLVGMAADREDYGRILREMQVAVEEYAAHAEELGMSLEGSFLRDLAGLLEKTGIAGLAPHQDKSVMIGYFMSLICMQVESMLLRYLERVVARAEVYVMMRDFMESFETLLAHPTAIDRQSAARIAERMGRFETFLMADEVSLPLSLQDGALPDTSLFVPADTANIVVTDTSADQFLNDSFAEAGALDTWPHGAEALSVDEFFSEEKDSAEDTVLHEIFREECEDHLVVISRSLNSLEEGIVERIALSPEVREVLGAMRRAVHTLKGAAAMVGYEQLAACAHSLEDMLDWLYDDAGHIGPDDLQTIASAIDLIELLAQQPTADHTTRVAGLQQTIARYLESGHVGPSPASEVSASLNVEDPGPGRFLEQEDVSGSGAETGELENAAFQADDAFVSPYSGNIRVKIENLDEIIGIEGELIVARSSMEGILNELLSSVDELNTAQGKLRRISQELESGFEVQSLYGFGPDTLAGQETVVRRGGGEFTEFDPIELDRYSQLNLIIRSLNELSVDVNSIHTGMASLSSELSGQIAKQQLIMGAMQDKLMRTRMTPMSAISRAFFRTVRNTARQLDKNVRLTVTGDDIFMDRLIWSKITDPLMHILRNCIDHGIESPAIRKERGKPETASIRIEAQQLGSFVILRIADDGAGIDTARLREKLASTGLVNKNGTLTDEDLLPYLFRTGLSTKDEISHISGRGVGLDVVQKNIQELRGTVRVETQAGKGAVFELRIPITLSVNRAILIDSGDRQYAIPLQDVVEIKSVAWSEVSRDDSQMQWNDELLPVKDLAAILQLRGPLDRRSSGVGNCLTLIVRGGKGHVAVVIDQVKEQREIVVKNLGTHLSHVKGVSGVTILGDGSLIPVLNLSQLVDDSLPVMSEQDLSPQSSRRETPLQILIVDDSISVRQTIARLVKHQSWRPELAVDGVDALEKLETFHPDAIILDIEMPRMNGYEFMSILRKTEKIRSIPVIMLTSRTSGKHRTKADELGVDFYMTKPFQDEAFVQLLGGIRQYRRPQ